MKKQLSTTYLVLAIAYLIFSCSEPAKEETKNNAPKGPITLHVGDENYALIDTTESIISWKGSNSFGSHTGYVHISKGELLIENSQIAGGTVEVDMNTIEDEEHQTNSGLIKHLKDPDFFDVKKFPLAAIDITKVTTISAEDKEITGNLTIKGITQPVSFPARIEVKDGLVKAMGKLVIDRTRWGVRYGSGKFLDNLKNETISDSIEFNITIVAKNR
ncbi:MAG TPA: YceI family protein [Flavisolibacter sp.]|nr:YceI family protein [Flavisolibacter sp.]